MAESNQICPFLSDGAPNREIANEKQTLRDIFGRNVKKYRNYKVWSQFTPATKIDMPTFLAEIEARNTWAACLGLLKLAKAFKIKAHKQWEFKD
jgi:ribosome-binding protein aMBF1 (putative translation factor)